MRRSTRIIAGIEVISLLLIIIADWIFASATLREYMQAGVLILAVVAGIVGLGWAKPRGMENKVASAILILSAVVFQIAMFVLLGIKLGFVANVYRFNPVSIIQVWLPLMLIIIFTEILRGQMIGRGRESRGAIIMTAAVLTLLQVVVQLPPYLPLTVQNSCELIFAVVLPIALMNVLLTYIAYAYDYRASVVYRLVIEMPIYLLPIYPDMDIYLRAVFGMALTVVLAVVFINHRRWDEQVSHRMQSKKRLRSALDDRQRKTLHIVGWSVAGVSVIGFLSFCGLMSGLFHYFFLAIGSGSMEPNISRGDLVLVERADKYEEIAEGAVLVYRYKNIVMVHRVSEVEYDGKKYQYRTKGDANENADVWVVEQGDVIGVAKSRIVVVGFPTLWLNELFNKE